MARGSNGESVLHRQLRILDAFDPWHPFLTVSQIANVSGLAMSTAHRLIGDLVREGLLERLPDKTYRLGLRLWELGSRTPGALGLREIARPALTAVHERVRQHAQLGVLSGLDVLFIERMSAPDAVVNATLIGGRTPLYASSSGLVLLAGADDNLTHRVIAHGIRPLTPHGIQTEGELRARVRQVRADGFAITDGYIHPESRGIAVPVSGPGGEVFATLSVVVPNDDTPTLPYIELLQWAAARTTRALVALYSSSPGDSAAEADDVSRGAPVYWGASKRSITYFSGAAAPQRYSPR